MKLKSVVKDYKKLQTKMVEAGTRYGFQDERVIIYSQQLDSLHNVINELKYPNLKKNNSKKFQIVQT